MSWILETGCLTSLAKLLEGPNMLVSIRGDRAVPIEPISNVNLSRHFIEGECVSFWTFGLYGTAVESAYERELATCQLAPLVRIWAGR